MTIKIVFLLRIKSQVVSLIGVSPQKLSKLLSLWNRYKMNIQIGLCLIHVGRKLDIHRIKKVEYITDGKAGVELHSTTFYIKSF